jgi:error-prone DNA polymerase
LGVCPSSELGACRSGQRVRVAGVVVIRQQPPTAKGFVFLTLEDEDGLINVIVRPDVFERYREVIKTADFLLIDGAVQSEFDVVNVLAYRLELLHP